MIFLVEFENKFYTQYNEIMKLEHWLEIKFIIILNRISTEIEQFYHNTIEKKGKQSIFDEIVGEKVEKWNKIYRKKVYSFEVL